MFDVVLSDEERRIRDEVRDFVRREITSEYLNMLDRDELDFPLEVYRKLGERNLLGVRFPREYGGRGSTWVAECAAVEEVGVVGSAIGCAYSMPSIVGEALYHFGTEEQKRKYLVPMLKGKLVSAEALTEPRGGGGSDFFGTTTTARKDGEYYVLNGEKRFIAGGKTADFILVYARTNLDPNVPGHRAISAFIVERGMGVEVAYSYNLLGFRGMGTSRLVFKDVHVPAENLLGKENEGAAIFNRMMVPERLTSAAGAIGGGRAALDVAIRYSILRRAFGRPIRDFQGVSFKVAESVMKLDAARALTYMAARAADQGLDARRLVAEAKAFSTEAGWEAVNNAMQILGGIGYTTVYPVERALRDARLGLIWTGSNEVMRMIIQHEVYKEYLKGERTPARDIEEDAADADKTEEKRYE
ncbi:MAG: acyl-CoA/acyl-ACP dehydrogenase [Candidatus Freyarchaeota archaeon]|nr:acyl-CoA/acyl-ACP dehydrogenase [Candidatus Jordarchaeia archaeon]